jgi:DNA mismatch repair ATPase MutS
MDYILADEKIIFLYKLKEGRSQQSFGINVAQVVKIPMTVIERARERSVMM